MNYIIWTTNDIETLNIDWLAFWENKTIDNEVFKNKDLTDKILNLFSKNEITKEKTLNTKENVWQTINLKKVKLEEKYSNMNYVDFLKHINDLEENIPEIRIDLLLQWAKILLDNTEKTIDSNDISWLKLVLENLEELWLDTKKVNNRIDVISRKSMQKQARDTFNKLTHENNIKNAEIYISALKHFCFNKINLWIRIKYIEKKIPKLEKIVLKNKLELQLKITQNSLKLIDLNIYRKMIKEAEWKVNTEFFTEELNKLEKEKLK